MPCTGVPGHQPSTLRNKPHIPNYQHKHLQSEEEQHEDLRGRFLHRPLPIGIFAANSEPHKRTVPEDLTHCSPRERGAYVQNKRGRLRGRRGSVTPWFCRGNKDNGDPDDCYSMESSAAEQKGP